ncbi:MAG: PEGA domain-containing protein [Kofleriaceae bacterium]|nr:PEGA domain-containing protein [Myxococcales bacterium]MCB9562429.1 PEGA domain-containing protein [Kofleriaceae bacterium]
MRRLVAVVAALGLMSSPLAARADEGDAPDVAPGSAIDPDAPPAPKVEARVAVLVLGEDDEPLPSSVRATLQVSMERALEHDHRLEIVDQDTELARRAGEVPADVVSEARGLVSAGEALLRRNQADAALAKLEAASAQLTGVLAWAQKSELARAQFLLGAAHAIAGDDKAALAEFVALQAWRPEFVADPTIRPREVLPVWEKAQAKAARLPGGSIEISSSPDGAMAYVDGRFVGFTPTVVEALPAATHYVTVRMHGRVRSVTAVKVSDRKAGELRVSLDPTPGVERLQAAVDGIAGDVGKRQASALAQGAFGDLAELLEVQHAVILVAPEGDGPYRGYVYAVEGGSLLARAEVRLGERDPEAAFGELATKLYDQISFEPPAPPETPRPATAKGKPFYRSLWFWGGVAAVVTAGIAVPLLMRDDGPPPLSCPQDSSCGTVVLRF